MINSVELKAEMIRHSISQEELSRKIGLDPSTFSRKLNNKSAVFTVKEAQAIAGVLDLSSEQCAAIFFAQQLA